MLESPPKMCLPALVDHLHDSLHQLLVVLRASVWVSDVASGIFVSQRRGSSIQVRPGIGICPRTEVNARATIQPLAYPVFGGFWCGCSGLQCWCFSSGSWAVKAESCRPFLHSRIRSATRGAAMFLWLVAPGMTR